MYYLGLDIGSSSVKAGLVEAANGKSIHSVHEPKNEMGIVSQSDEWAEQDPNDWWLHTCKAIQRVCHESNSDPKKIISIGISLQILVNLINDLEDFLKGVDNNQRLGPTRAVQSGGLSIKEMKLLISIVFMISLILGFIAFLSSGIFVIFFGIFK